MDMTQRLLSNGLLYPARRCNRNVGRELYLVEIKISHALRLVLDGRSQHELQEGCQYRVVTIAHRIHMLVAPKGIVATCNSLRLGILTINGQGMHSFIKRGQRQIADSTWGVSNCMPHGKR